MAAEVSYVFVYGTLKRGQIRERMWPRPPVRVFNATTRGTLFDLGEYPAMTAGTDLIEGEVWQLAAEDMEATLHVLDQIEDYRDAPDDLYKRVVVECELDGEETGEVKESVKAFTYHYAAALRDAWRIPTISGRCSWPTGPSK